MQSFYVVRRQAGFVVAIAALLLALVVPALASAAEVTARSITLSSASKGAEDVSYKVQFTPAANAGAVLIDFCDGPSIGATCNAPVGLDVTSAEIASGFTIVAGAEDDATDANTLVASGTLTAGTPVTITIDDIDNPDAEGTIYARIVTYDTSVNALGYVSTESNATDTNRVDTGSVAIAIHDTIAVSGAVNESLTFCVSSKDIDVNCTLDEDSAPTLELGAGSGATKALSSGELSTGDLYAQISTNAVSGAIVNLKSSALDCGGLINSSNIDECFITPSPLVDGLAAGKAMFGVIVNASTDPNNGEDSDGAFQVATGASYNDTNYFMNYVDENASGVTSVFGDPFLDTDGAPASNKNMKLTFGASISNSTPAGKYSTDLSLIATGKF